MRGQVKAHIRRTPAGRIVAIPTHSRSNQFKLRSKRINDGIKHHQKTSDGITTSQECRQHLALARKRYRDTAHAIWIKPRLAPSDDRMRMWTVYAKSDWTPALKKEYKSFWTEVVDIYKKRLSQLQTQKSFAVQPNEQYHILRDRTCSEGEFYLQHPKTQKTCKCLVRKGLKLRKSWGSTLAHGG